MDILHTLELVLKQVVQVGTQQLPVRKEQVRLQKGTKTQQGVGAPRLTVGKVQYTPKQLVVDKVTVETVLLQVETPLPGLSKQLLVT